MGAMQRREEEAADEFAAALPQDGLGERDIEAIGAMVDLLADAPVTDETLTKIVELMAESLDLGGATLSLVRDHDGSLLIEPLIAVGIHAAFTREMSARPLESLADVATAVKDRTPVFVGAAHGAPGLATRPEGVGRWRSGVSLHTTGVLPLCAQGETLGVLTVEWPDSRPLGDGERRVLDTVAKLMGLGLHVRETAESDIQEQARERSALDTSESPANATFSITSQGHVVPLADEEDVTVERALLLETASGGDASEAVALFDTVTTAPRTTAIFLGVTTRSTASHGVCTHGPVAIGSFQRFAGQHVAPSESLVYIDQALRAGWVDAERPATLSATVCEIRQTNDLVTLTLAGQGAATWMLLAADGRLSAPQPPSQPDSGSVDTSRDIEHHLIGLPGDRLVLVCSDPSAEDAHQVLAARVRAALEAWPSDRRVTASEMLAGAEGPAKRMSATAVITIDR